MSESLALLFANGRTDGVEVICSKMLKEGLKVSRVHSYVNFSLSQILEKITWIIEKTSRSYFSKVNHQKPINLITIVCIGEQGLFV